MRFNAAGFIYFFNVFEFSALLTVSVFFFAMGGVMDYFKVLGYVPMSVFHSLKNKLVVVTNDFLEDIISVLDRLYPVCYKIKVIFQ